jgi:hypothetical protein
VPHGFLTNSQGVLTFDAAVGIAATFPVSINSFAAVAGMYWDASQVSRGFVRNALGVVTTFDMPNSTATYAYLIDDLGVIAGSYNIGNRHSAYLCLP